VLGFDHDRTVSLSFGKLADRIAGLSAGLLAEGLGDGKRVAIAASNSPDWIVACLAVINVGGVAVPLDGKLDEESLEHVLEDSRPALLFASAHERKRLERLSEHPLRAVSLDGEGDAAAEWERLAATAPGSLPDIEPESTAVLFYTSGTTGLPKGVPLSHRNLLFELRSLLDIGLMAPGERLLLPLPLHHVYPFVVGMLAPLAYGVAIVLPRSMTGPHVIEATRTFEAATVVGVPRLYEALVDGIEGRVNAGGGVARLAFRAALALSRFSRRRLSLHLGKTLLRPLHRRIGPRLRLMASGGAALAHELAWTMESLGWTVATGYGLTETAPLLTIVAPGDTHFDSAGRPLPGIEVRVTPLEGEDADGAERTEAPSHPGVRDPRIGEIEVRGPNVFAGYRALPERTREAFTADGWFRTEDRGWIDQQGYLHVVGRASTFVVTPAGKNISLEELERTYERHRLIREIGIFMRDGRLCAVAVPDPGELRLAEAPFPEETLRKAVREQSQPLPRYRRVDDLVVSRNALARTRLGKIRRDKLRQRFDEVRRSGGASAEAGPMAIDEMSGEDQALLDDARARRVWEALAARYPKLGLSPDSDVAMDLGIDSLEWITITFEISEHTGVQLSEQATARIQTVRDLLREVVEHAERGGPSPGVLTDDPERYLSPQQKRWLAPLGPIERVFAWLLYIVNRALIRTVFRIRVSGLEHLAACDQVIVAPNHLSAMDPVLMAAILPYGFLRRTAFAGWTGIAFANPVFRLFVRLAHALPVETDRAAFSSLALALAATRQGLNLVWFPEGRRSRDGALQAFRPGVGILVEAQRLPVVPTVIRGTFEAMPAGRAFPRLFQRIDVRFGAPLTADQLDAAGHGERPQDRITEALHRAVRTLQAKSREA
jgi:long-chain acyl-CoA synthetase